MLCVFCHAPPFALRQGLLLNLALAILAHVTGPQALRIHLSLPPALRLQEGSAGPGFYLSTGIKTQAACCAAGPWPTKPSPQPAIPLSYLAVTVLIRAFPRWGCLVFYICCTAAPSHQDDRIILFKGNISCYSSQSFPKCGNSCIYQVSIASNIWLPCGCSSAWRQIGNSIGRISQTLQP